LRFFYPNRLSSFKRKDKKMLGEYLIKIRERISPASKILREILVVVCAILVVIIFIFVFVCWRLDIAVLGRYSKHFSIPRVAAVKALMTTRKWGEKEIAGYARATLVDEGVIGLEQCGWGPMRPWVPAGKTTTSSGEFLEILLLSDAQIRDTHILDRKNYSLKTLITGSSYNYGLVNNSVFLAAILRGYRKAIASYDSSRLKGVLAVFTGDLLEFSLVTEMIDGAGAVNYACKEHAPTPPSLPFLLVPGNHDGLIFVKTEAKNARTWELGLNQLEFSLASLELLKNDRSHECAVKNEAVTELLKGNVKILKGAHELSQRLKDRGNGAGSDVLHYVPVALKGKVKVADKEVGAIQTGYFSVVRNGFRIICLDTRSEQGKLGNVGPVQLGWLYHELSQSLAERQPVLIFAHHHPRYFQWLSKWFGEGKALKNMVGSFPHVLGYFSGHKHKFKVTCEDSVWFVQAPSLVHFPMGALLIRVERQKDSQNYRLTIEHVKAGPDRSKGAGLVLDGLQDEALVYAWYDSYDSKKKELKYSTRICASEGFMSPSKPIKWDVQRPEAKKALANDDLIKSITEKRVLLLNEKKGAWCFKPHP
jgi:Calcineurin-like phosphoesterase